jgi:uncharacterized SAM-binding protein YcdF (DUF218 family)
VTRRIAIGIAVLLVAGVAATAKLFIWPSSHVPARADAVVVLSGDRGERLARGLELMNAGVAPTLVLAGGPDFQQAADLCLGGQPFEVVCLRPVPDSTRHEARAAARLASDRGWGSLVVVTTTTHLTRAGLLFRRCVDGTVHTVKAHRDPEVGFVVHEWLGVLHALVLARGC